MTQMIMMPYGVTLTVAAAHGTCRLLAPHRVFTDDIGGPLSPDCLTRTFNAMVEDSGLPPVRLHDLRHGAATLMLLEGADLKTIADQLGHSSVVLTADTYLSVAVELGLKPAADVARLVLQAGKGPPGGGDVRRRSAPVLAEITA
jgi:integrase